jgi:NADH-quinone oxidoreductase subunit M
MEYLLILTVFLPLVGAAIIWSLSGTVGDGGARPMALTTSIIALALAIYLAGMFPIGDTAFAVSDWPWIGGEDAAVQIRFSLGLDGLGLWMFVLSAVLTLTSVLVSWEAIVDRKATFYGLLLVLETGMLGVFAARDIILFYIFFEFTLLPLFFLIGVWGSEERRYAAVKFFLYTLAGSLLTFLSLLAIVLWHRHETGRLTFLIPELTSGLREHPIPNDYSHVYLQLLIFLGLFAGFAIKVPLFPLHTWLPLAHTQAPTAGSVILAGILLKIGTYGFLRFSLPMLPAATAQCMPWILWLSVAGILYGALVALAQSDMKRLIAYSSVSHLGFCMVGIFVFNPLGVQGGALQMVNHGLSTGGLFAVLGMLYERYHTRQIADVGGVARRLPVLSFFFVLFTFSSIGLPGLNGFAGEFLLLTGAFQRGWSQAPVELGSQLLWIAVLATFGVVLGAWYMLYLVQRVFFGPLKEPLLDLGPAPHGFSTEQPHAHQGAMVHRDPGQGEQEHGRLSDLGLHHHSDGHDHAARATLPPGPRDLTLREILAVAPLVVFVFWIGLYPQFFLDYLAPSVDPIAGTVAEHVYDQHGSPQTAASGQQQDGATTDEQSAAASESIGSKKASGSKSLHTAGSARPTGLVAASREVTQ